MSEKKLDAIKEIEFRIRGVKKLIKNLSEKSEFEIINKLEEVDSLLFDINDFIDDLRDE